MVMNSPGRRTKRVRTVAFALSSMLSVAALSTPLASAATTTTTIDAVATQMVNMGVEAHSSLVAPLVAPVLAMMSQPGFDWKQAVFGTDTLSSSQQQTAISLTSDIQRVATFSAMDQAAATALINDVIAKMQALNPAIQTAEVLNFLSDLEAGAPATMVKLHDLQSANGTLTQTMVEVQINALFSGSLASASTDVQAIFAASGSGSGAGGPSSGGGGTPSGSGASLLGTLLNQVMVPSAGTTLSVPSGTSILQLLVPANAFATPQQVSITTGSATGLPQGLPSGYQAQFAFGVSFGTTPTQPLTLTIEDAQIPVGAKVYKVTASGWVAVPATVTAGKVVISFSTDPDFVIVKPLSSGNPQKPVHLLPYQRVISLAGQNPSVVPGLVHNGTTYMPIWYVMHMLSSLNVVSHWNGTYWYLSSPTNMAVDLSKIQPGVGKMKVYLNGNGVLNVTGITAVDPTAKNLTTYMPIYDIMLVLNRLHIKSAWDGTTWTLTPSN